MDWMLPLTVVRNQQYVFLIKSAMQKRRFEWTDEFVYRILVRGIFPGSQYDIQETKDAVEDAIDGKNPEAALVPDAEHCGEKVIFPVKGRLVSFPFVREGDIIIVKSAFHSQKKDIEAYAKKFKMRNKNIGRCKHD